MIEISEEQLERVEKVLIKALESQPATSQNTNMSRVHVDAGGIGVLILLVASAFVLGIALFTAFNDSARINRMEQRQDRQDDYVNTIYQYAPQIPKPKEK